MLCVRGFGEDALYKSTFYITLRLALHKRKNVGKNILKCSNVGKLNKQTFKNVIKRSSSVCAK